MSEDDKKTDDKENAEAQPPRKKRPQKTLVGIAPVTGSEAPPASASEAPKSASPAEAKDEKAEAAASEPPGRNRPKQGTLVGIGVTEEQIAADKAAREAKAAEEAAAKEAEAAKEEAAKEAKAAEDAAAKAAEAAKEEAAEAAKEAKEEAAEAAKAEEKKAEAKAEATAKPADKDPQLEEKPKNTGPDTERMTKPEKAPAEKPKPKKHKPEEDDEPEKRPALYLSEYETPEALARAAMKVRDAGYESWDCHTPYPVHGLDDAMGLRPTGIGWISFIAAMTGLVTAVLMIQYMNNWDYPIVVGGKPPGAFPSMVPIMFELTVLLCGFGTLFGLLHLARLPRHHHPIFESERFAAATDDKFFISIEVADEKFDLERTRALLESTDPSHLELVEEEIE